MPRSTRARIRRVAAIAGAIAVAAPAAPALADTPGFTLNFSGPSAGVVGQPLLFRAAGSTPPPDEYWFPVWFEADAIPASVMAACPDGFEDAFQVAHVAGENLAFAERANVSPTGAFTNAVAFTPKAPGTWLICGYSEDGAAGTLAHAQATVNVSAAPAAPATTPPATAPPAGAPQAAVGAKPTNAKAPRVSRSGSRLVCTPGRWSNASGGYSYGWSVNGRQKKGATGRKLRITRALRGRRLTCSVTASNAAGATTAVSRPVRVS
jgi:hypothetical protein